MAFDFIRANSDAISYADHVSYDGWGHSRLTIAVYVNMSSWTTLGSSFVDRRIAYNSSNAYSFGIAHGGAANISFNIGPQTNTSISYKWSHSGFDTDQWVSLVGTCNGANGAGDKMRLYVDGVAHATPVASSDTTNNIQAVNHITRLGKVNDTGSNYFDGKMAEVAIWSDELTAEEAAMLVRYSPAFVRPDALVFYDPLIRTPWERLVGQTYSALTADVIDDHPSVIHKTLIFNNPPEIAAPAAAAPRLFMTTYRRMHLR